MYSNNEQCVTSPKKHREPLILYFNIKHNMWPMGEKINLTLKKWIIISSVYSMAMIIVSGPLGHLIITIIHLTRHQIGPTYTPRGTCM